MNQVRIQAMRECDARHRGTGLAALLKHQCLQLDVVSPPRGSLGVFHDVHLISLVDTILGGATSILKMGSPDAYTAAIWRTC